MAKFTHATPYKKDGAPKEAHRGGVHPGTKGEGTGHGAGHPLVHSHIDHHQPHPQHGGHAHGDHGKIQVHKPHTTGGRGK